MPTPIKELVTFDWCLVKENHVSPTERQLVYEPSSRVGHMARSSHPTLFVLFSFVVVLNVYYCYHCHHHHDY